MIIDFNINNINITTIINYYHYLLSNEVILIFEPIRILHCTSILVPKSKSPPGLNTDEVGGNQFLATIINFCVRR
jgi:hypothetical protein